MLWHCWFIWLLKTVPKMTYSASHGTVNLYSLTHPVCVSVARSLQVNQWTYIPRSECVLLICPMRNDICQKSRLRTQISVCLSWNKSSRKTGINRLKTLSTRGFMLARQIAFHLHPICISLSCHNHLSIKPVTTSSYWSFLLLIYMYYCCWHFC